MIKLKQHYVRFGDLETSLVEICNCMQRVEEHFVMSVVLQADVENSVKLGEGRVCLGYYSQHIFISVMLILHLRPKR